MAKTRMRMILKIKEGGMKGERFAEWGFWTRALGVSLLLLPFWGAFCALGL